MLVKYFKGSKIVIAAGNDQKEKDFADSDKYKEVVEAVAKVAELGTENITNLVTKEGIHITFIKKSDNVRISKHLIDKVKAESSEFVATKSLLATYVTTTVMDIILAFEEAYDIPPKSVLEAATLTLKITNLGVDKIKNYTRQLDKSNKAERAEIINQMINDASEGETFKEDFVATANEEIDNDSADAMRKRIKEVTGRDTKITKLSEPGALLPLSRSLANASNAFVMVSKVVINEDGSVDGKNCATVRTVSPASKKIAKSLGLSEDELEASVFTSMAMSTLTEMKKQYSLGKSWFEEYFSNYHLTE